MSFRRIPIGGGDPNPAGPEMAWLYDFGANGNVSELRGQIRMSRRAVDAYEIKPHAEVISGKDISAARPFRINNGKPVIDIVLVAPGELRQTGNSIPVEERTSFLNGLGRAGLHGDTLTIITGLQARAGDSREVSAAYFKAWFAKDHDMVDEMLGTVGGWQGLGVRIMGEKIAQASREGFAAFIQNQTDRTPALQPGKTLGEQAAGFGQLVVDEFFAAMASR